MQKDIVIFGVGKIAEVIHYYAVNECGYNVAAFTVDAQYITADTFLGVPVVDFASVKEKYAPENYGMFVAVGYHDLNRLRETKCKEAEEMGYKLVSVISPAANVPSNVKIGKNCFIMSPAVIHPCVEIGNDVFIWSGSVVGHHSNIKDHCWLTSGCNISGNVTMGENTFVAINATLGHSVTIGKENFIGSNALVIKNTEDGQVLIAESTKPIKLNSRQFLRMSSFSNL
jgi:sugar O-acyltransferase (sialic acid O-acetyltransferase NeuD family)